MNIAERLKKEEEGFRSGIHCILLSQLQRKFSQVPEAYQEELTHANAKTLTWSDRILDVSTLEDLFKK